jgi:hypothetical protein
MSNLVPIKSPPLVIRYWEFGINLVTDAKWNASFIKKEIEQHIPRHRDAAILFNNAKMFGGSGTQPPKCRLYWNWRGMVMTCIPPVEEMGSKQIDFQHLLNAWLRKEFGIEADLQDAFDEFETRYADVKARRKAAKKALKKIKRAS